MIAAANPINTPVGVYRLVVDRVKAWQIGEKMTDEPGEGLGAADHAERHFQIMAAPAALKNAPGTDKTLAQERSPLRLPHHLRPEIRQQRPKGPRCGDACCSLSEAGEEILIQDPPLLERQFTPALVEGNEADGWPIE